MPHPVIQIADLEQAVALSRRIPEFIDPPDERDLVLLT